MVSHFFIQQPPTASSGLVAGETEVSKPGRSPGRVLFLGENRQNFRPIPGLRSTEARCASRDQRLLLQGPVLSPPGVGFPAQHTRVMPCTLLSVGAHVRSHHLS